MLRIGLTGGIGSGKTTAARIFEVLGIPVYYADIAAKKLMNEDKKVKKALENEFGKQLYAGAELDTKLLAEIVFDDEQKLQLLNAIVHPATIADAEQWIKEQTSPYAIKEAALLFESGSDKFLDLTIGVSAPLELRIQRTMARDKTGRVQVMARISKQMDDEKKLGLCDFVLLNDEQQMLIPQVLHLHQKLLQLVK